jgi:tetratricopeptide (TPR) repeat protein
VTLARTATLSLAITLAPIVAVAVLAPGAAQAQSAKDLEAAKAAFAKGKAAFDKGNFGDAVDHFKESYRLSKNPLLLYNIALTFERLLNKEMAVFYYKKFLEDAPAEAEQRPDAEKNLAALEKGSQPEPKVEPEPEPEPEPKTVTKRTTACTVDEVQHQIVEDAPPGKPLDLTAFVPADCGWTVTLFYRGAGKESFTSVAMRPRYNELVARIPQEEMAGNAVQYYVEFKNDKGELVHKIGKSTSPNVVYIDEAARPRYYPDLEETVGKAEPEGGKSTFVDEEDPLTGRKKIIDDEGPGPGPTGPTPPTGGGERGPNGLMDVGSSKFTYAKWGATGTGVGMLGLSVTFYFMASSWANSLEAEAARSRDEDCPEEGGPPCRPYNDYRKGIEATGQRYETLSKVTFTVGVLAAGVAGYFWYKELKGKKKGERVTSSDKPAEPVSGLRSLVAAPMAGDDFIGGAAALRF